MALRPRNFILAVISSVAAAAAASPALAQAPRAAPLHKPPHRSRILPAPSGLPQLIGTVRH